MGSQMTRFENDPSEYYHPLLCNTTEVSEVQQAKVLLQTISAGFNGC